MAYRSAPHDDPSREVTFKELSLSTQLRLSAACSGRGVPPLASEQPARLGTPALWGPMLLTFAAISAFLLLHGFGDISGSPRVYRLVEQAALVLTITTSLLALAMLARSLRSRRGLPFPPGVYLFAHELVDARGPRLMLVPTARLEGVHRARGRAELHFAGGERYSFRAPINGAFSDLEREIAIHLDAFEQAERRGDVATQINIDPFDAERARWSEQPLPVASARARSRLYASPWLLLTASLLLGPAVAALAMRLTAAASDASAIHQAHQTHDANALEGFLRASNSDTRLRHRASEALFDLARQDPNEDGLVRYLTLARQLRPLGLPHQQEASDELHRRITNRRNPDVVAAFIELGQGPLRDEEERAMLDEAFARHECDKIARHSPFAARSDEVHRLHVRCQIEAATLQFNAISLHEIALHADTDESRREASAALSRLYQEARDHLAKETGLRTPLARFLDEVLRSAGERSTPLELCIMKHATSDTHSWIRLAWAASSVPTTHVNRGLLRIQEPRQP